MTDRYAVIGNPISQSKSPLIHTAFAQATGQDLAYTKIEGPLGQFAAAVDAFRAEGGRGLNITAPFKLDAFAYATHKSPRAELAGAANAMKFEGDQVWADNFDGVGLVRDVVHNLGVPLAGKRVLMLGAGGAARGALLPFLAEQPARWWWPTARWTKPWPWPVSAAATAWCAVAAMPSWTARCLMWCSTPPPPA